MDIIYRASDGREFDLEHECLDYEYCLKTRDINEDNIILFSGDERVVKNN